MVLCCADKEVQHMSPIKELWYGNIIPQEDGIFNKPQFKELLGYTARHRGELEEALTNKQKELLDKMMDNRNLHRCLANTASKWTQYGCSRHLSRKKTCREIPRQYARHSPKFLSERSASMCRSTHSDTPSHRTLSITEWM